MYVFKPFLHHLNTVIVVTIYIYIIKYTSLRECARTLNTKCLQSDVGTVSMRIIYNIFP